ncbi:MAG TPA: enolase C-terminal domain-like protein, partial [Chloroflexota bacterium]|nr:enolase C-terminal domain-like protein [Chloroflexota bacterium]
MRIESVALHQIRLPLKSAFTTSVGTQTERPCIIVTVNAEGLKGYGECVAGDGPWYSYETVDTAWHIMRDFLIGRLLGANVDDPAAVWELFAAVRGHNMAKAALEMACWDLTARARGVPLAQLLGGERDRVAVGVSVGLQDSPEALVRAVDAYLAEGYGRFKIKIAPGHDQADVAAVRAAHPQVPLQVDANAAYTLAEASL